MTGSLPDVNGYYLNRFPPLGGGCGPNHFLSLYICVSMAVAVTAAETKTVTAAATVTVAATVTLESRSVTATMSAYFRQRAILEKRELLFD